MLVEARTLILATQYVEVYTHSVALPPLTIGASLLYVLLAKRYWFRIPLVGVFIATGCFLVAWPLSL